MAGNAAAIENVMAAGGSAGRGLPAGAAGGRSASPEPWLSGLAAAQEITRRPAQFPTGGGACES